MTDKQLKKLIEMPEEDINYSDIPNMSTSKGWKRLYPKADSNTVITEEVMFNTLATIFKSDHSDD